MPETRAIRADYAAVSCDVCGRTLLRGERPDAFLAGGVRRQVCELCIPRAQHAGWIREAGMDALAASAYRNEHRRRSLLDRFRGQRDRAREAEPAERDDEPARSEAPAPARTRERRPERDPRPQRRRADRGSGDVRAVPTNAELKNRRAIELFNGTSFPRTVSGVARSLGPPGVCVRPRPERPSVVTITVMWELSWYRFEVDLSDEAGGVRRDAHGTELSELDPAETQVNAAADERGALHLRAAAT